MKKVTAECLKDIQKKGLGVKVTRFEEGTQIQYGPMAVVLKNQRNSRDHDKDVEQFVEGFHMAICWFTPLSPDVTYHKGEDNGKTSTTS